MKAIVLDRDGVINKDSDAFIKTPDEWIPIPGSLEAMARLSKAGYKIFIATNQSGVARGFYTLETLQAIHNKMLSLLQQAGGAVEKIAFCPHGPKDGCACRKPKTGMLEELIPDVSMRKDIPMVGDAARDIRAGIAAGMPAFLVLTGKGKETLQGQPDILPPERIFTDLAALTDRLLA